MIRLPSSTEMTTDLLQELLNEHAQEVTARYKKLKEVYMSDHEILHLPEKDSWKPDNRIVVNFPKFMVDTTNGFFIGNPIKTTAKDEKVSEYVEYLEKYNGQDDNNAELSKLCGVHGKAYEMYYANEDSELCTTYLDPIEAFMVFDESIVERPLYFIRRYMDRDKNEWGSISNSYGVRNFKITGGVKWTDKDWQPHNFSGVPATEFIENEERQGIFEPIMTMVNAYNKALSEKANDVDYFADAYLKILGVEVDNTDMKYIRDNRIINLYNEDGSESSANDFAAEFLDKPNNDTTQEHLLDRLERLIFCIGQTANTSDENFGTNSGIAMLYKMWSTSNRGKTKERKFESGMNRRYMLLFSHPLSKVPADSWVQLSYTFTPNIPSNLLEEAQIAQALESIVSRKTQLKVLSIVDNVEEEKDNIKEEEKEARKEADKSSIKVLGFGEHSHKQETETEEQGDE